MELGFLVSRRPLHYNVSGALDKQGDGHEDPAGGVTQPGERTSSPTPPSAGWLQHLLQQTSCPLRLSLFFSQQIGDLTTLPRRSQQLRTNVGATVTLVTRAAIDQGTPHADDQAVQTQCKDSLT